MEEEGYTGSNFKRVCVFCGSHSGNRRVFSDAALELGNELVCCTFFFLTACVFWFCDGLWLLIFRLHGIIVSGSKELSFLITLFVMTSCLYFDELWVKVFDVLNWVCDTWWQSSVFGLFLRSSEWLLFMQFLRSFDLLIELELQVRRKINLVYGGGSVGLMGLISQTVYAGGCHVLGSVGKLLQVHIVDIF